MSTSAAPTPSAILQDPVEEALRVLGRAEERGVPLRVIGGIAVALRAPSVRTADPPRTYHDLDLAGRKSHGRDIVRLLEDEGYEPHVRFNTLSGSSRLLFFDPVHERRVDVFLDRLEMCHALQFAERMLMDRQTLTPADLLLSKLQIAKLTDRDAIDVAALLADHPIVESDAASTAGIALDRLLAVCANDWGWWRTVTGNLETLESMWAAGSGGRGPDLTLARDRAKQLMDALRKSSKGLRWKARAAVGERVRWYQEPEEVR